jgi:ketosteroid isomerase-like protein
MNNDLEDFKEFMMQREAAAKAYVSGDAEPFSAISARDSDATFFGPNGGFEAGAEKVLARYQSDAESFEPDGESYFEILQIAATGGIAYWTGFQRATARFKGKAEAIAFNLRITEIFRRKAGEWKLVHRHADSLAEEKNR